MIVSIALKRALLVGGAAVGVIGLLGVSAPRGEAAPTSFTSGASGKAPANACFAEITAVGGSGYANDPGLGGHTAGGGYGATLYGVFPVVGGQSYQILFALGGLPGPDLGLGDTGGRGGDASAVSIAGHTVIAAGGGGGGGGSAYSSSFPQGTFYGGNAGNFSLSTGLIQGQRGQDLNIFLNGAQGGFPTGEGGIGHPDASPGQNGTTASGSIGAGGRGGAGDPGTLVTPSGPGGGGGGAGYNTGAGGGGGSNNQASGDDRGGSGGGGNSYIDPSAIQWSTEVTPLSNHTASVTLDWILCVVSSSTSTSTTSSSSTTTSTTTSSTTTTSASSSSTTSNSTSTTTTTVASSTSSSSTTTTSNSSTTTTTSRPGTTVSLPNTRLTTSVPSTVSVSSTGSRSSSSALPSSTSGSESIGNTPRVTARPSLTGGNVVWLLVVGLALIMAGWLGVVAVGRRD